MEEVGIECCRTFHLLGCLSFLFFCEHWLFVGFMVGTTHNFDGH